MRTSTSATYVLIELFNYPRIVPIKCRDPDILPKNFMKALLITPSNF